MVRDQTGGHGAPHLQVQGASKRYGAITALQPIHLDLPRASITVLIGPSGCGKTTLLRLLNGLTRPDAGEVRFAGEPLTPSNLEQVRRKMGYVIQDGGLFPHLTAGANVTLMARYLRWSPERIAARQTQVAELVRLPADVLDRPPLQLSGGQRQRVALMRALMLDPEVLLLDEPLGALDPLVRRELQEELAGLFHSLGKTVVLVTHDLAEAAFFGGRILLLREGSVVQDGTLEDLVSRPADPFVTAFVSAQRPPVWLQGGQ